MRARADAFSVLGVITCCGYQVRKERAMRMRRWRDERYDVMVQHMRSRTGTVMNATSLTKSCRLWLKLSGQQDIDKIETRIHRRGHKRGIICRLDLDHKS